MENINKPKIGILTFHSTANFGATLQCYGLYRYLESKGAAVEVINYMQFRAVLYYAYILFVKKNRNIRNIKRVSRFLRFFKGNKFLKLSGRPVFNKSKLKKLSKRYDAVFVGSDEVWKAVQFRKWDTSFFLDFADPARQKIFSYGASMSDGNGVGIHKKEVKSLLERFHGISVRDNKTAEIVKSYIGKSPAIVADPSLLHDFSELLKEDSSPGKYVFVYGKFDEEENAKLKKWAASNGLEVYVADGNIIPGLKGIYDIGPKEWINLLKNASLVITRFFHGLMFSVKYSKPLLLIETPGKSSKINDFLAKINNGIQLHAKLPEFDGKTINDFLPDYKKIHGYVENMVKDSAAFVSGCFEMISSKDNTPG